MQAEKRQAAIYCRVAHADGWAIENQRRELLQFAAAQGYDNCAEYFDNGENGLTLDRPAFSRLHNDMLCGTIQVIFVTNISRIGRNILATTKWLDTAKKLGIEVISQQGDLNSDHVMPEFLELMRKSARATKK